MKVIFIKDLKKQRAARILTALCFLGFILSEKRWYNFSL